MHIIAVHKIQFDISAYNTYYFIIIIIIQNISINKYTRHTHTHAYTHKHKQIYTQRNYKKNVMIILHIVGFCYR